MVGILLIVIAIVSSFYINKNNKKGSILLIIIGILFFFYSLEVLPQIQLLENDYNAYGDFTYIIPPWDLLYLTGMILFFAGLSEIIKKEII
jgi:Na+/phosphate symporter